MASSVKESSDSGSFDYDLFTIGAGSGGVRASRMSAAAGGRVAICEMPFSTKASDSAGGAGGTCVIRGCVPKKLLVYGSSYATSFQDAKGFEWELDTEPRHHWGKLIAKKNAEINRLTGIYQKLLGGAGVEYIEGRGKIVGPNEVEVNGKVYTARNILISTGGRVSVPDLPGVEHVISSDDALELPELPKSMAIVGSGYIALEFACIFNAMGVETHVFYRQPLPLRGFDEEVRQFLYEQMVEKGIHMHPNESPEAVEKKSDDAYVLKTASGGSHEVGKVMFATGRKPNVNNLGLETVGVEMAQNGAVKVDPYSKTTAEGIWAIGDVTDRINLTPVALMEGMAICETLFKNNPTKADHTEVPCAVFTQPPVSCVGMTEEEAIAEFGDVDVYTSNFRPMKHTISGSGERCLMKLIVHPTTDKVVGVHIVGDEAGEIMQGIAIAVRMGATKHDFDRTIGIHPTAAEELVTMRTVTRQVRKEAKAVAS